MGAPFDDQQWMKQALELARTAGAQGEIPVGAILVENGQVIGTGYNQSITLSDCSAHAEILALRDAGHRSQRYRFPEATLYCTLEPCAMCAGAMLHARIERLVYGADDAKAGAAGSVIELLDVPELNHRVLVSRGVGGDQASHLLREFFKAKR